MGNCSSSPPNNKALEDLDVASLKKVLRSKDMSDVSIKLGSWDGKAISDALRYNPQCLIEEKGLHKFDVQSLARSFNVAVPFEQQPTESSSKTPEKSPLRVEVDVQSISVQKEKPVLNLSDHVIKSDDDSLSNRLELAKQLWDHPHLREIADASKDVLMIEAKNAMGNSKSVVNAADICVKDLIADSISSITAIGSALGEVIKFAPYGVLAVDLGKMAAEKISLFRKFPEEVMKIKRMLLRIAKSEPRFVSFLAYTRDEVVGEEYEELVHACWRACIFSEFVEDSKFKAKVLRFLAAKSTMTALEDLKNDLNEAVLYICVATTAALGDLASKNPTVNYPNDISPAAGKLFDQSSCSDAKVFWVVQNHFGEREPLNDVVNALLLCYNNDFYDPDDLKAAIHSKLGGTPLPSNDAIIYVSQFLHFVENCTSVSDAIEAVFISRLDDQGTDADSVTMDIQMRLDALKGGKEDIEELTDAQNLPADNIEEQANEGGVGDSERRNTLLELEKRLNALKVGEQQLDSGELAGVHNSYVDNNEKQGENNGRMNLSEHEQSDSFIDLKKRFESLKLGEGIDDSAELIGAENSRLSSNEERDRAQKNGGGRKDQNDESDSIDDLYAQLNDLTQEENIEQDKWWMKEDMPFIIFALREKLRPVNFGKDLSQLQAGFFENTLGSSLKQFSDWLTLPPGASTFTTFLVSGPAGYGKSVLAAQIIKNADKLLQQQKICYFFCKRNQKETHNPINAIYTLCYQLCEQINPLAAVFFSGLQSYEKRSAVYERSASFEELIKIMLVDPLSEALEYEKELPQVIVVLDGLENIPNIRDAEKVLSIISSLLSVFPEKVRLFLTTENNGGKMTKRLKLGIKQKPSNAADLKLVAKHEIDRILGSILKKKEMTQLVDTIVQKANGTYLTLELIIAEVEDRINFDKISSLEDAKSFIKAMPNSLEEMYGYKLEQTKRKFIEAACDEDEKGQLVARFQQSVEVLVSSRKPLSLEEFTYFTCGPMLSIRSSRGNDLGAQLFTETSDSYKPISEESFEIFLSTAAMSNRTAQVFLGLMGPLVSMYQGMFGPMHKSFVDYIFDSSKKAVGFHINAATAHARMAQCCLDYMVQAGTPGVEKETFLSVHNYATLYGHIHLEEAIKSDNDFGSSEVHSVLNNWINSMMEVEGPSNNNKMTPLFKWWMKECIFCDSHILIDDHWNDLHRAVMKRGADQKNDKIIGFASSIHPKELVAYVELIADEEVLDLGKELSYLAPDRDPDSGISANEGGVDTRLTKVAIAEGTAVAEKDDGHADESLDDLFARIEML